MNEVARVQFAFLTSGPSFEAEVPDNFGGLPLMSSPICTRGNSSFRRSFDFSPSWNGTIPSDDLKHVRDLFDRAGRKVELFKRDDPPAQWYLQWELESGCLTTHLRAEDGPDRADPIVRDLRIDETAEGLPFLLPEGLMSRGVMARPGYEETATFRSRQPDGWTAEFLRPGYLSAGQLVTTDEGGRTVARVGLSDSIELLVSDQSAARGIAEAIASSFGATRA